MNNRITNRRKIDQAYKTIIKYLIIAILTGCVSFFTWQFLLILNESKINTVQQIKIDTNEIDKNAMSAKIDKIDDKLSQILVSQGEIKKDIYYIKQSVKIDNVVASNK